MYPIRNVEAQTIRVQPDGTDTLNLTVGGSQEGAGKYAEANAAEESIYYKCFESGKWHAQSVGGTWTVEP